jgi:hypothetical protein
MRMRGPLGFMAGGLAIVAIDFRAESLDFLPDPLGWLLVALAAYALGLRWAASASAAAAVLSGSTALLAFRYRLIDPFTLKPVDICPPEVAEARLLCSERVVFDPVTGWRLAALAGAAVLGVGAVVLVLTGLRRRARRDDDPTAATRLSLLRAVVLVAWGIPELVAIAWALTRDPVAYDPIWNDEAEYVALVGLVAIGWLAVELCFWIRRRWALPSASAEPSPWSELIVREP